MTGDVFGTAGQAGQRTWVFVGANNLLRTVSIWHKPRGCRFISLLAVGSGGGGGCPALHSAGVANAGGSGGGSGAVTQVTLAATLLPDVLYVYAPEGGRGGQTAGSSGAQGWAAFVSVNNTTSNNSQVVYANGGTGGSSGAAASTGGAAATAAEMLFANLGIWTAVAGQGGAASVSGAAGGSTGPLNSIPVTGGAAGGGMSAADAFFSGGSISAGYFQAIAPAEPDGIGTWQPFIGTGGAGGTAATPGGRGGNGFIGCGGGGGGTSATTSGAGGNGGPGLVIITAW